MALRAAPTKGPSVMEGSPAEAVPGDELLWVSNHPAGPAHLAIEVGLVLHEPARDHVRVLSPEGAELEFAADRVVVLVRDVGGVLERSRASDGPRPRTPGT